MFFILKPKIFLSIVLIFLFSFGVSFGVFKVVEANNSPSINYTIVLDAGHGGRDAGCTGNSGVKESDLSLAITRKLQKYLVDFGFEVIMTRENQDGLYDKNAKNFKLSDMEHREEIIKNSKPNMLISIHLNAFPSEKEKGAQCFYEESNIESIKLSNLIQQQLKSNIPNARENANKGDYFILKTSNTACSLVECGFLSNKEEEEMLLTESHQQKLAYAIFCGIISYLNQNETLSVM